MEPTRTAYGIWSGGRFMHFGEPLPDDRFLGAIQHAYHAGIRTFMTADVYGTGAADEILKRGLEGFPRDTYCLVGAVGHDFYHGKREGAKGFPRFTNPALRPASEYASYLRMATEKSLARCGTDRFDLLMLHNPDSAGYTSAEVWNGMLQLKEAGLTKLLGIAPGPANGFTLDLINCFEQFGAAIDWAMIILNPLEHWPGSLCLPAAQAQEINIITRVVDYGGLFHDDVRPGHAFPREDHRAFRPNGWVEAGCKKIEQLRPIAAAHNVTMLQLACLWNLSHPMVRSVIPTLIQESGPGTKPIEAKIEELGSLPDIKLTAAEINQITRIGDNKGCMSLKGGNPQHEGEAQADRWSLTPDLEAVSRRWGIVPERDLVQAHP